MLTRDLFAVVTLSKLFHQQIQQ